MGVRPVPYAPCPGARRRRVARVDPPLLPAALQRRQDKVDAPRAVLDGREVEVERVGLVARQSGGERAEGVGVDVGERLVERLGVARREPARVLSRRREVGVAAAVDALGTVERVEDQLVGLLLVPHQRALGAGHPKAEVVLEPGRDLGAVEHAARAALVPEQHVGVVVHGAALDEGADVGADPVQREPGDVARQVLGVAPDVAEGPGPGFFGVRPPDGLLHPALLDGLREPALAVLRDHLADLAQLAVRHHRPRVLHEGVARVVVRQRERHGTLADGADERFGVPQRRRHRLVADDGDPALDERQRRRRVEPVRRDDGDDVDAVGAPGLGVGHLLERAVGALDAERGRVRPAPVRVRRKNAGHEGRQPVHPHRAAVDVADEGAGAAADHAGAEGSVEGHGVGGEVGVSNPSLEGGGRAGAGGCSARRAAPPPATPEPPRRGRLEGSYPSALRQNKIVASAIPMPSVNRPVASGFSHAGPPR